MFEQSITRFVFTGIKKQLSTYKSSIVYNLILRFVLWLKSIFEPSIIHDYVVNNTRLESAIGSSVIYNLADSIIHAVLNCLRQAYNLVKKHAQGGILHYLWSEAARTSYLKFVYLSGAFFVVMMIVPHNMWNNIYAVAGAFGLAVLYLLGYLSGRDYSFNVKAIPLSLVAFVTATVGGIVMSPDKADGIRIGLFFISSVIFALLIWGGIPNEKNLKRLVVMITAALTVMCVYGLYQHLVGVEVDILLTDVETNKGMPGRIFSSFENPNNFAEAIILVVPFLYALFLSTNQKGHKALYAGMFVICIAALAMTFSRSGYVAFVISTVVFVLIYDWRYILPLALIAIVCIPLLPQTVWNRILTIGSMQDTSNSYRIYLWGGVTKMIRHIGIGGIGIGPKAFAAWYPSFAHIFAAKAPHSHMLYMELLVEIGIIGLMGYLFFLLSSFKKGLAVVNKTSKTLRCMIIAAISSFCGISFTACAEYIWFYPRVMFVFWIVAGILMAAVRISRKHSNPVSHD